MHCAVATANSSLVELLHSAHADVNRPDIRGRSPLMYVALHVKQQRRRIKPLLSQYRPHSLPRCLSVSSSTVNGDILIFQ